MARNNTQAPVETNAEETKVVETEEVKVEEKVEEKVAEEVEDKKATKKYKALVSFSGLISMVKGQEKEIEDEYIVADLLKANYIKEIK